MSGRDPDVASGRLKPTREEVAASGGLTVPDVIGTGLRVLFCGINPGLYSGATGHHFARPGNRFWRTLHGAGFTDRALTPYDEELLLDAGLGITNLVRRTTAAAAELTDDELRAGARALEDVARRFRPGVVAILGVSAYRTAFDRTKATIGPQVERLAGSRLWILPNPSGLNANYQLPQLIDEFRRLRESLEPD